MNREELRNQAAGRRSAAAEEQPGTGWHCAYCSRTFSLESRFMKHACPERDKLDTIRGAVGQRAYTCYTEWMKLKKRSVPPIETFAESKLFNAFVRFSKHIEKVKLPNVPAFIKLMVEHDVPPVLWTKDTTYAIYLKAYDAAVSPEEQVDRAIELLAELVLELNVQPEEIYQQLGVDGLEDLIAKRKLTFWSLLCSSPFKRYLQTLSEDDRRRLVQVLRVDSVGDAFNKNPLLVKQLSAKMKEVGL